MKYPLELLNELQSKEEGVNKTYLELDGVSVKSWSKRFGAFKDSQVCYLCGLEATHLQIDSAYNNGVLTYHLNMYAGEVLMTVDHVIPLSKGGKTVNSNLKTCCTVCNRLRGNTPLEQFKYKN